MGMFDSMFNQGTPEYTTSDMLKAFIPIIGPILAGKGIQKKSREAKQKWLSENMAYTNPAELDDMGRRVQERMLARTGGEMSTPGLIAATAMQREARDPGNMGNMGNVAMKTAASLAGAGQTDAATTMAQVANKQFQTPWKPSEGGRNSENFQFPDGKVVTLVDPKAKQAAIQAGAVQVGISQPEKEQEIVLGSDLKIPGAAAQDAFAVERNPQGKITSIKKLDNAPKISVSATSSGSDIGNLISDSDISKEIMGMGAKINAAKDTERVFDELTGILKANPYGVTGWGGAITAFGGKAANLAGFIQQSTTRINSQGESEASVIGRFSGRINEMIKANMPTVPQAQAAALTINLAYAIARMNNMGTAGGGRGITDADMEYAMKQLGSSSTPEAMIKVLESERKRARMRMRDDLQNLDIYIKAKDETKGVPKQWIRDYENIATGKVGTDPEIDALVEQLLNPQSN